MRPAPLFALLLLPLFGCGKAANAPTNTAGASPRPAHASFSSGTPLERYLPLVGGHRYQYEFQTDGGDHGLLIVTIERSDARHGSWTLAGGGNAFEYVDDGVLTVDDNGSSYLLKAPVEAGKQWRGGHQSTIEVRRVDVAVTVPAGQFHGCVETVESRAGDTPFSVTAVYCPDVGMVSRDVATGAAHEQLTLKSFGAPVDLGPDGVSVTQGD